MNNQTFHRSFGVSAFLLIVGLWGTGCPQAGGPGGGNDNDQDANRQKQDLWTTDTASSSVQDFSFSPLPAGFFDFNGRSCDAFAGAASFVGTALSQNSTGVADTVVTRGGDPVSPSDSIGATGTVAVQITGLNLHATEPIQVTCDGQATDWYVQAALSDTASPAGSLTALKTHDNGGTAETSLPVLLKLTFTNVEDASVQRVLDFAENGLDPIVFLSQMTWVHRIDPNDPNSESGFIVGVAGGAEANKLIAQGKAGPRLQGGQTLIACSEHGNPGGSHLHNTCTADTDHDGIPDGVDNCRFQANPDQADRDDDRFGDVCDPFPDDPDRPQSGGECEGVCREVNDDLTAAWEEMIPTICELLSVCLCLPPSCDPLTFEFPERCLELSQQLNSSEFSCLYTRFSGWGCDRCVLPPLPPLPCPDPCETATCPEGQTCQQFLGCVQDFDLCQFANCPAGQGCDPQNGQCCENPDNGCPLPTFDLCEFVVCPAGSQCNPTTGLCWDPETGECFASQTGVNLCEGVTCVTGKVCNQATGLCSSATGSCANATCAAGEFCDPFTGACVSFCEFIECPTGQVCSLSTGQCVSETDPCLNVTCATDEYCAPATGTCVPIDELNVCDFVTCPTGQVCNPATGLCN